MNRIHVMAEALGGLAAECDVAHMMSHSCPGYTALHGLGIAIHIKPPHGVSLNVTHQSRGHVT